MRIFIITQDEPIYAPFYLRQIIQKMAEGHTIVGVTALSPSGHQGWLRLAIQRLAMYGVWDFIRAASLFASCKAKDLLPLSKTKAHSVLQVARQHTIPVYPTPNINDSAYLDILQSLNIDLLLSVAANQRFRQKLLDLPRVACLNVHSSLLPKYRGLDGLFWALASGESEVGVTVHVMSESFDDGGIVAQQPLRVMPKDSLHDLYLKAIELGSSLVARSADLFQNNAVILRENDASVGTYFSWPTKEAVKQFRAHGRRFF